MTLPNHTDYTKIDSVRAVLAPLVKIADACDKHQVQRPGGCLIRSHDGECLLTVDDCKNAREYLR